MKPTFHPAASEEIVETTAYYEREVPNELENWWQG